MPPKKKIEHSKGPKGGSKSTPSEKTKLAQAEIMRLRRDYPSMTWEEISHALKAVGFDMGRQQCYMYYKKALKEIIREPTEEVVEMELARLDEMYSEVMRIMRAVHPVVSQGRVMWDILTDEEGMPVIDALTQAPVKIKLFDAAPKLAAVDRGLKIMERRAKLLGIDKEKNANKEGLTPEEFASQILNAVSAMEEATGG